MAAELKHGLGLTLRKTARTLEMFTGLKVSAGGLAQAFKRMGKKLDPEYEEIKKEMREAAVVHSDETSWWVGKPQSLWVFCNPDKERPATLYRVVASKDRGTFYETIPPDFKGVLVSDCLSVYDNATEVQHKCYAHHLKAAKEAQKQIKPSEDTGFIKHVKALLRSAIEIGSKRESLSAEKFKEQRRILEIGADALLKTPRSNPREESLRLRLYKQRDHLFVFLDHEGVDATNNLAERQIRPAVIARKLSCGNKTEAGARAWEVLTTLVVTCSQRTESFIELFTPRLRLFGNVVTEH
jgi:hypothetical protein